MDHVDVGAAGGVSDRLAAGRCIKLGLCNRNWGYYQDISVSLALGMVADSNVGLKVPSPESQFD